MIHVLYDSQKELLVDFMSCCLKPESVSAASGSAKKLQALDVESNMLPEEDLFIGAAKKIGRNPEFLQQVKKGYITCVKYLQKKLPINNPLFKALSACDPSAFGHQLTQRLLLKLPDLVQSVLTEVETTEYEVEIRKINASASTFPPFNSDTDRLDVWYNANIFPTYPLVKKMVSALLSCFHGPRVESAFSIMGEILDKSRASMKIETLDAIQTVKYNMLAQQKSAIEVYRRADHLYDPVDPHLCKNMGNASHAYRDELRKIREEKEQKKKALEIKHKEMKTKKQEMLLATQLAKKSRKEHIKRLQARKEHSKRLKSQRKRTK